MQGHEDLPHEVGARPASGSGVVVVLLLNKRISSSCSSSSSCASSNRIICAVSNACRSICPSPAWGRGGDATAYEGDRMGRGQPSQVPKHREGCVVLGVGRERPQHPFPISAAVPAPCGRDQQGKGLLSEKRVGGRLRRGGHERA